MTPVLPPTPQPSASLLLEGPGYLTPFYNKIERGRVSANLATVTQLLLLRHGWGSTAVPLVGRGRVGNQRLYSPLHAPLLLQKPNGVPAPGTYMIPGLKSGGSENMHEHHCKPSPVELSVLERGWGDRSVGDAFGAGARRPLFESQHSHNKLGGCGCTCHVPLTPVL